MNGQQIIATRLSYIKPSPTLQMSKEVTRLRQQGVDVIGLAAGEPDFDTPDFIKEAAIEAIRQGKTKYTSVDGILPLREAIVRAFKESHDVEYHPENVIVGCGAKHVLFNALLASVNKGDEVIIPAPYWVSYPDMVLLAEGTPVIVPCSSTDGFKLTPEILRKVMTKKSKWLVLNSPNNPSGAVYSAEELKALLDVVCSHEKLCLLSDDIYEQLVYGDSQFATAVAVSPDARERILTVNGVSKAYAMTGWRIGYALGEPNLIRAMAKIQSQSTSNACSVSQYASLAALTGDASFLHERREVFARRRKMVVDGLNEIDGLACAMPDGAFYVFPSCEDLLGRRDEKGNVIANALDYGSYLLRVAKVAVVSGEAFGLAGHLRISYATSDELLKQALQRIKEATSLLS